MGHHEEIADDERPLGRTHSEQSLESTESVETLAEQVRQLREALREQRRMIEAERAARRGEQQALVVRLAAVLGDAPASVDVPDGGEEELGEASVAPANEAIPTGAKSSRRGLLKWGGAAAAAAAAALVASEQHAAHASGTIPFDLAVSNVAPLNTSLAVDTSFAGASPSPLLQIDVSSSAYDPGGGIGPIALSGLSSPSGGSATAAVGVYGNSTGFGVYGLSTDGIGTYGRSTSNFGVEGQSTTSFGVWGSSDSASGVQGESTTGNGVTGFSLTSNGVTGSSTNGVDVYAGGTGRLLQKLQGSAGAPTFPATEGEMIRDSNGELWLCVATGGPGQWVRASHPVYGYGGGAVTYLSMPIRLLDTRSGASDARFNGGGPLVNQQPNPSYTLQVASISYGGVTVPTSAVGAIGNVTVVATSGGPGYVSVVPSGAGFHNTSNINYTPSQTIANFFIVGLSPDGKLDIYVGGAATDVIIDLFAVVS